VTVWLLWVLAGNNLAAGLYLVRYSGAKERQRPEAVLVVGVLLVLTSLFLVSVAVKIHAQRQIRQQLDDPRPSGVHKAASDMPRKISRDFVGPADRCHPRRLQAATAAWSNSSKVNQTCGRPLLSLASEWT